MRKSDLAPLIEAFAEAQNAEQQAKSKLEQAREEHKEAEESFKTAYDALQAYLNENIPSSVKPKKKKKKTVRKSTSGSAAENKKKTAEWLVSKLADGPVAKADLLKDYRDEDIGSRLQLRHHDGDTVTIDDNDMVSLRNG